MPGAKLDDDKIYLTYVLRKDISSKGQLIKMLLALEKGTHVDLPYFKVGISIGQGEENMFIAKYASNMIQ